MGDSALTTDHEAFLAEIERMRQDLMRQAAVAVGDYFRRSPARESVREWLTTRCWREMEYVLLISEILLKYRTEFDAKLIASLCKQLWEEAKHHRDLGACVERLGGTIPKAVTPPDVPWSRVLWEGTTRDKVCAVAGWYMSESSGSATMRIVVDGMRANGYPDVAKVYEYIDEEETFHVHLGRAILERYATTPEARGHALWAADEIRKIMTKSWAQLFAMVGA